MARGRIRKYDDDDDEVAQHGTRGINCQPSHATSPLLIFILESSIMVN